MFIYSNIILIHYGCVLGARLKPFIASVNGVPHVVVEGETMYKIHHSCEEGLLTFMAVYYVFNLQYEAADKSTLGYIKVPAWILTGRN